MFTTNRAFLGVLLCLATLVIPTGCQDETPRGDDLSQTGDGDAGDTKVKKFILLTNGEDPFWDTMEHGMNKVASDLKFSDDNIAVEMDRGDGSQVTQINKLKSYASQPDIVAVAISVTNAGNVQIAKQMQNLRDKGKIVITVDSDVDRRKFRKNRFAYIGTDNIIAGNELGKATQILRPQGGEYATFVGLRDAANAIERIRGFGETAGDKFKNVENRGDRMDFAIAEKNVRDSLINHPNITTLVGIWSYNAHYIVKVAKERNVRDKTTIVVFDARSNALGHLKDGNIDAMVVQDPYHMGYLAMKLMKALLDKDESTIREIYPEWESGDNFKTDDGDIHITDLRVVVPNDASPVKREMFKKDGSGIFDKNTIFFTYDEFRKWLGERGLTGS